MLACKPGATLSAACVYIIVANEPRPIYAAVECPTLCLISCAETQIHRAITRFIY